jgi:hypothetical protein
MKASSAQLEVSYRMDILKFMLLEVQALDSVQKVILAQLELMHQFHVSLELMALMNKHQLVNHAQLEIIVTNVL